jgi:putative flippase GtrA
VSGQREFGRFLVVGGIAALANIASRIVLDMAMPYELAIVIAYLIGMTCAYALSKVFVFAPSGRSAGGEYVRFTLVNLVAIAQVWIVSVGLARFVLPWVGFEWHAETVAHVIGVSVPVVTSYYGHKHFSFAGRADVPPSRSQEKNRDDTGAEQQAQAILESEHDGIVIEKLPMAEEPDAHQPHQHQHRNTVEPGHLLIEPGGRRIVGHIKQHDDQ